VKLDRNINPDGRGKYALVLMREASKKQMDDPEVSEAINKLHRAGCLDFGPDKGDFFVIRLKDKYAAPALAAYALAAYADDREYGLEILNLAKNAAE